MEDPVSKNIVGYLTFHTMTSNSRKW